MCSLSSPQIMLRGHIFDTIAQNYVELLFSKPFENSLGLTILLSCNSKGLFFNFYLNRKRNKCWLMAYSCDLFTYQYISCNASWSIAQIFKIEFKSLRNKFHQEFNGSRRVSWVVGSVRQNQPLFTFYCTIDQSSPWNLTVCYLCLNLGCCWNSRKHLWMVFLPTFRICIAASWRK